MALTRQPAVAGAFYPGARNELERVVADLLEAASTPARSEAPKAIVAPHAGYVYSGAVAASAYVALRGVRSTITRVVLLGPTHRVPVRGLATTNAESFLTPLGAIPIDRAAVNVALRLPQVQILDAAHAQEHSLEVHLPFLQQCLEEFSLVPFSVGDATDEEVAAVLEALWGGRETLIVVSSDLSHYHDYRSARELDANATRAIERLDPDALDYESACGRVPVRGLLLAAKRHGLTVETVDLRNSGDTAGPKDRVVGYGSYLFTPSADSDQAEAEPWDERFDAILLDIARRSIEAGADSDLPLEVDVAAYPAPLRAVRASFVTLELDGRLRGCIGSLDARSPMVIDVAQSAFKAAYRDPRFAPVSAAERPRLDLHVSVLSPMAPISFVSEEDLIAKLRPGVDGLVLRDGRFYGTFLPDVWEGVDGPRDFLRRLKQKAGLPPDHWSATVEMLRYTTRSIR